MKDTGRRTDSAHAVLWRTLQKEAHEIAQKETFLAPMLERMLLTPDTPHDALACRLAHDLTSQKMNVDRYRECLLEALLADPTIIEATVQDLMAVHSNDPACTSLAQAFLNYKGFHAVQTHRIANHFWKAGRGELAAWLSNRVSMVFGPDIHPAANLGAGLLLDHGSGIVIGETAVVEDNVTIMQNVTLGGTGKSQGDRHPKVRQGVMIGAGAKIIGNIEIGAFSKVGAGSVVLKDVPAECTVVGVPAQIVRLRPKAGPAQVDLAPTSNSGSRLSTSDGFTCTSPTTELPQSRADGTGLLSADCTARVSANRYASDASPGCQTGICETLQAILCSPQQPTRCRLIDQRKRIMAFVAINNQAPLGAVTTLRVVDSAINLIDTFVAWNEARLTRKVLMSLSADQLEDIGLSRAELF